MSKRTLLTAGAIVLVLGAALHCYGWAIVGAKFAGPLFPVSRLFWFSLPIDWLVVAAIWFQCARGGASMTIVRIAAIIPIVMAIGGFAVIGPRFIGAWVFSIAAVLGLVGSRAISEQ